MNDFRCTAASVERSESQVGTASTVRAFVLLECAVRWGREVLRDAPLPHAVRAKLAALPQRGVKVLLVRKHGRAATSSGPTVFVAYADPRRPWLEGAQLGSLEEVADLDLGAVAEGRSPGLTPMQRPLVCVCTHGRHDVCCAELGRPVAKALHASHPDVTWEISHIGGDRFAGNVLVLPHGLYYGRVTAQAAPGLVASHLQGHLDLDHLRGRSCHPTSVQASEWFLRRHLDESRIDGVLVGLSRREGSVATVEFTRGDESWRVAVRTARAASSQLTCRAVARHRPPAYELVSIDQLS